MSLPTPKYDLNLPDNVYPPSEDTFLLLDALESELKYITEQVSPSVILEIGPGSGVVTSFLLSFFDKNNAPASFCVDVNPTALNVSRNTMKLNEHDGKVEFVQGDLLSAFNLHNQIDVLVFNPPYVPTDETAFDDLSHTYAGGEFGRDAIDGLFPLLPKILSRPNGTFYLVALHQNDIQLLLNTGTSYGFRGSIVLQRRAGIEKLYVLKFVWSL